VSNSARDRVFLCARRMRLERTPVIVLAQARDLLGDGVEWPGQPQDVGKSSRPYLWRSGWVYCARDTAGRTKVGFSSSPEHRLRDLDMDPILLIVRACTHHERALHRFLDDERVDGEFFVGQRTDRFVQSGIHAATARYADFGRTNHWRDAISKIDWIVTKYAGDAIEGCAA